MKKSLFLIFITIVFMGLLYSQITVTHPTAGQTWCKGSTLTITWTSSGSPTPNVKIRLRQGAVKILDIHDSTTDDGTYNWPVPGSLANGSYFIRVASTDGAMIGDSPNFTITNCGGTITVTQPIAGQEVCKNNTLTIQWTSSSLPTPNVKIRLRQGGVKILDIHDSTLDDGTYNWPVPGSLASGSYFIRVASTDGTVIGDSPNFNISVCGTDPPQWARLRVTNPKSSSKWRRGGTYPIKWSRMWLLSKKAFVALQKKKQFERALKFEIAQQNEIMLLKTVKIEIRRVACKLYPLPVKKKLFFGWKIIKKYAFDGKFGGTYNWHIPFSYPLGCYKIRITENRKNGRTATSATFHIIKGLIIKPGVFKEKKVIEKKKVIEEIMEK